MAPNSFSHDDSNVDTRDDPNTPSYAEQLLFHQSFKFQVRRGKLDLLKLMKVDLGAIARETDIDTLQSLLENTTFCNLTVDELRLYSPDSLYRLFVVMQLTTEYLLNVQNTLAVNINALARKYSIKKREVEDLKGRVKSKDDYIVSCLKKEKELRDGLQRTVGDDDGAPNGLTPSSSNQRNQEVLRSASSVEKSKTIVHLQEQAMELAASALKSQKEFERIAKLLREDIESARIRENNAKEELDRVRQSLAEAVRSEVRNELQAHHPKKQVPSDTGEKESNNECSFNINDVTVYKTPLINESFHTVKPFSERLYSVISAHEMEAAQTLSTMKSRIQSDERHQSHQRGQPGEGKEQWILETKEGADQAHDNDSPSSKLIGSDIIGSEETKLDDLRDWHVTRFSRDSDDTFQRDRMYTLSSTASDDTFNKLWTEDNDSPEEVVNKTSSIGEQCATISYSSMNNANNFPKSVDSSCVKSNLRRDAASSHLPSYDRSLDSTGINAKDANSLAESSVGSFNKPAAKVDHDPFYHEHLDSTIGANEESKVIELSDWIDEDSKKENGIVRQDDSSAKSSNEIALISGLPTATSTKKKRKMKVFQKLSTIRKMIAQKKREDNLSVSRGWKYLPSFAPKT